MTRSTKKPGLISETAKRRFNAAFDALCVAVQEEDRSRCIEVAELAAVAAFEGRKLPPFGWHEDGAWFPHHPKWSTLYARTRAAKLRELRRNDAAAVRGAA